MDGAGSPAAPDALAKRITPGGAAILGLKLLFTVGGFYLVFRSVALDDVAAALAGVSAVALAAAFALLAAQAWLSTLRWRMAARVCSHSLPLRAGLRYFLASLFYNQALPSTIPGDAVRVYGAVESGAPVAAAVGGVVLDRVLTVLALALLVVLSLLAVPVRTTQSPLALSLLAIGMGFLAGAVLAPVVAAMIQRRRPNRICRAVLDQTASAVALFTPPGRGSLVAGLSLLIHLLSVFTLGALQGGLGLGLGLWDVLSSMPGVILLALLPVTINGWGVREAGMVAALAPFGTSAADAVALSVAYGVVQLILALAAGALSLIPLPGTGSGRPRGPLPGPSGPTPMQETDH